MNGCQHDILIYTSWDWVFSYSTSMALGMLMPICKWAHYLVLDQNSSTNFRVNAVKFCRGVHGLSPRWISMTLVIPWVIFWCHHEVGICSSEWDLHSYWRDCHYICNRYVWSLEDFWTELSSISSWSVLSLHWVHLLQRIYSNDSHGYYKLTFLNWNLNNLSRDCHYINLCHPQDKL